MTELSERMKNPSALLNACRIALPSWSAVTLDTFSMQELKGGFSSPGLYLVENQIPGVHPSDAVVRLEPENGHSLLPWYRHKYSFLRIFDFMGC